MCIYIDLIIDVVNCGFLLYILLFPLLLTSKYLQHLTFILSLATIVIRLFKIALDKFKETQNDYNSNRYECFDKKIDIPVN